jgi:hypothetical protein
LSKKIFIITGESSGDKISSLVIKNLIDKNLDIKFLAIGGENIKSEKIPVKLIAFDILYLDGKETLSLSLEERRKILEMDKEGAFLPVATKRIFLKYYTKDGNNKYSIWTKEERDNYKEDIRETLKPYLSIVKNNTIDYEN